jgi:hypothetical protein
VAPHFRNQLGMVCPTAVGDRRQRAGVTLGDLLDAPGQEIRGNLDVERHAATGVAASLESFSRVLPFSTSWMGWQRFSRS